MMEVELLKHHYEIKNIKKIQWVETLDYRTKGLVGGQGDVGSK